MPTYDCEVCGKPAARFVRDLLRISRPDGDGRAELQEYGKPHAFCVEHDREPQITDVRADGVDRHDGPTVLDAREGGGARFKRHVLEPVRTLHVLLTAEHVATLFSGRPLRVTPRPEFPDVEILLDDVGFSRLHKLLDEAEIATIESTPEVERSTLGKQEGER